MTTQRIEELKGYKQPTQLNGTDYYRLPVNKLEHIISQAHQAGISVGKIQALHLLEDLYAKAEDKAELIEMFNEALQDNK